MEFTKLLEERRSIRAFDPEKHVTAEQIQEIVQAAIQAPSWKNSQTTRIYAGRHTRQRSWKRLGLLRSRPARRKPDPARKRTWP